MAELRIERRHQEGDARLFLGKGKLVCLDGDAIVGFVDYTYWRSGAQYARALVEKEPRVEGPFFRRSRKGQWVASVDIEVNETHRRTAAFRMLIQAIDAMDMPVYARFGNERLREILRRRYKGVAEPGMARVIVKRILRKHGYPPDKAEQATLTVLKQAELLGFERVESGDLPAAV